VDEIQTVSCGDGHNKERSWSKEEREKNSWSTVSMHFDLQLGVFMSRMNTIQPETGKHFDPSFASTTSPIVSMKQAVSDSFIEYIKSVKYMDIDTIKYTCL
jgi:hypothetical protein